MDEKVNWLFSHTQGDAVCVGVVEEIMASMLHAMGIEGD